MTEPPLHQTLQTLESGRPVMEVFGEIVQTFPDAGERPGCSPPFPTHRPTSKNSLFSAG